MSPPSDKPSPISSALWALALMLCGCAPAPLLVHLPADVPPEWQAAPKSAPEGPRVDLETWWTWFAEPRLDALVQEALAANLDLAMASSRLRQARLLAVAEGSRYFPTVNAGVHPMRDARAIDSYLHFTLETSWEAGLFGAFEANDRAVQGRLASAQWSQQAVRVTLVSETARHYVDLRTAQRQSGTLERLAQLETRAAQLAEVRVRTRLGPLSELVEANWRAAQARAARAAQQEVLARASRALTLLTARDRPDPSWMSGTPTAAPGPMKFSVLPAELLRSRPDVRLAEAAVWRSAGEAGLARADLYPKFGLTGGLLYSYNFTQNRSATSHSVVSLGPLIDIPLFDWDRRRSRAAAAEEGIAEALLGYRKAVLAGIAEVEVALVQLSAQGARGDQLREGASLLQKQSDQQHARELSGLSSEYEAIAIARMRLQATAELEDANANQALALVALYKALGGAALPAVAKMQEPEPRWSP